MNTQGGILSEKRKLINLQNEEVEIKKRLERRVQDYINNESKQEFPIVGIYMTLLELVDNKHISSNQKSRVLGLSLSEDLALVAKSSDYNKGAIQELLKSVNSSVDSVSENRKYISSMYMWLFWAVLSGSVSLIMCILSVL